MVARIPNPMVRQTPSLPPHTTNPPMVRRAPSLPPHPPNLPRCI